MVPRLGFIVPAVFTLALAAMGPSVVNGQAEVSGYYLCEGQNPGGQTYQGTVEITRKGGTYLLHWTIGQETHGGVGILMGNLLSSSWKTKSGGGGIVVYRVEGDDRGPRLVGLWSEYPGDGRLQPETLTFVRRVR